MAASGKTSTTPQGRAQVADDLASRLRLSINRLHRQLRQESLAGLSPAQASALGSVYRLGGPTLGELASVEQVQPPTMTRIVASLLDAGLVTRVTDDSDRRSARVRITPAGKRNLERIRTLKNAFLRRRLGELDAGEQAAAAQLVELLEHLVAT
ncbi:MAG TPA: MarR family transcriptional regulator [Acidimicrobiales bacterium]|nr:MarR family transcriptional regulator [Acidimicrobiales bacterium]